jgi:pilus assembly protein Flp/PilA
MPGWQQRVRRFLMSEDGPTAVEYAVMLGMIIVVCVSAVASFGNAQLGYWQRVDTQMKGHGVGP